MIYLMEIEPFDPVSNGTITLRYGSAAYVTRPSDTPGNTAFEERLADPGNYDRHLFGKGRTRGDSDVGGGNVQLVNVDGALDSLLGLAFDGRAFRIHALDGAHAPWASRQTVLVGTMEQAEFDGWFVKISIRDRLALLRDVIQTQTYLGTTTSGGLTIAEGNADLKDTRKPLLFGSVRNVQPVTVDQFDNVFQVSARPLSAVTAVRDMGVPLTATSDYPTLAALKAALLTSGRFATCLALGLIRTQARPAGTLTVDATEGATLADRSAARIVQRMIAGAGAASAADLTALHAANPAECGIYLGTSETTILDAATAVLGSIGGWLNVDRFGIYRLGRLELPTGTGSVQLDRDNILDRSGGISRQATQDEGDGVPARSVTVRYARAYTTFSEADLKNVATTDAYRSFAVQEWRQSKAVSAANATIHPKGPELVFDTCLVNEADAVAEATRLLAIYSARRDVFTLSVDSTEVPTLEPGDVVTVKIDRFGMDAGRPLRVLGVAPTFATAITEIEAWG